MKERSGLVTMRGNPVTLLGEELQVGKPAPDFTVVDNNLKPVKFSSFLGKLCVIYSVPSLDTPVCDVTTRRFNQEAANLGNDVAVLVISMDLPFAQARWCGAAGITNVTTFSDHKEASFGLTYGVLIKEFRLLARAVFVAGRDGKLEYSELVKEIANEPNFDVLLTQLKRLV